MFKLNKICKNVKYSHSQTIRTEMALAVMDFCLPANQINKRAPENGQLVQPVCPLKKGKEQRHRRTTIRLQKHIVTFRVAGYRGQLDKKHKTKASREKERKRKRTQRLRAASSMGEHLSWTIPQSSSGERRRLRSDDGEGVLLPFLFSFSQRQQQRSDGMLHI